MIFLSSSRCPLDFDEDILVWNGDSDFGDIVILHPWEFVAARGGSTREVKGRPVFDNLSLAPCQECGRKPKRSSIQDEFLVGSRVSLKYGLDTEAYVFICTSCLADVLGRDGYFRGRGSPKD